MTLEEEIKEHERRLRDRDSFNQAVWDALMEGRTPPEKPKPRFRPESFFEPRRFKRKNTVPTDNETRVSDDDSTLTLESSL